MLTTAHYSSRIIRPCEGVMRRGPGSVTTLEQFFALPEDGRRRELLDGVYVESPNPSFQRLQATMLLYRRLEPALESQPDLLLLPVPGDIVLGPRTVVQPDLIVIPRPHGPNVQWHDLRGPFLAVEVRSTITDGERYLKHRVYQQAGVLEYWVVDLDARQVERWRPGDQRPEITSDVLYWQATETGRPFELDVGSFFLEVIEGR